MKRVFFNLILGVLVSQLISCDESTEETLVWGTVHALADSKTVNGFSLGDEGSDLVGYCRYENKKFSFAIGDAMPANTDFYYTIVGVKGPPSSKPYENGELRTDDDKSFTGGEIWTNQGAWMLDSDGINDEKCKVVLFAEAGSGDLTPKKFSKKPFQYVLKIDCIDGLNSVPNIHSAGFELDGFEVELWFDNCDS